jgi:hypothetical protein
MNCDSGPGARAARTVAAGQLGVVALGTVPAMVDGRA